MSLVGFKNRLFGRIALAALAVGAIGTSAKAASVTFASFQDAGIGQWHYSNLAGTLTASGNANFISFGGPDQVLNYTGLVTETLTANVTGPVVNSGGILKQGISGTLTFKTGSTTVLSASFIGAMFSGPTGSQSTALADDTDIVGQIASFTSSPSIQVRPFLSPLSFSFSFTQDPALKLATTGNTGNFESFDATVQGSFSSGGVTGAVPTSLPSAFDLGLGMMALLVASGVVKRSRRQTI